MPNSSNDPRWLVRAPILVFFLGIGLFLIAFSSNPQESTPATGHIYELNNHGDVVFVTKADYFLINGMIWGGLAMGAAAGLAYARARHQSQMTAAVTKRPANRQPWFLILAAAWIFYGFGVETVGGRLMLEMDGVVISRTPTTPSRTVNVDYVIHGSDGRDHLYIAGPTDASLPRDLTVGTRLRKQRGSLGYEPDGRYVDDFPVGFYAGMLALGVGCAWGAIIQWRRAPLNRTL